MRLLYQGLFNAANVVGEACKGAALVTEVMNGLGYESNPKQVEILRFSKTALLVIHNDVVLGHDPGMCVCVCVCVCVCLCVCVCVCLFVWQGDLRTDIICAVRLLRQIFVFQHFFQTLIWKF